jgi:A/G-specific adenine glycosylase
MEWYRHHRRDLPWRRTSDPYAIWVSEVMLQQTRVETVIPYYERFRARFPDIVALAAAPEQDLLSAWAGLGYYSRVRNMQRAAKRMVAANGFPSEYVGLRALPGIGDYTAAAIASIAFGEPQAVLDGNVMRVLARVTNDAGDIRSTVTRARLRQEASARLDPADPSTFNQAIMELGAMLCTPTDPKCLLCPVQRFCGAREAGRERDLPVKSRPGDRKVAEVTLLIVERGAGLLLYQRPPDSKRLAGFWELPEAAMVPGAELLERVGEFRHGITNTSYTFSVRRARVGSKPPGFKWVAAGKLDSHPLSTTARKALALLS